MIMNRIVYLLSGFGFGAGLPEGLDRALPLCRTIFSQQRCSKMARYRSLEYTYFALAFISQSANVLFSVS
jgi:hypothetical protein